MFRWCSILFSILLAGLSRQDVLKLQSSDVKEIIKETEVAWILHVGDSHDELEKVEKKYRGIFRVASMLHKEYVNETAHLNEKLKYIIYPYGIKSKKIVHKKKSLGEAVKSVLQVIPNHLVELPNMIDSANKQLRGFFQEAYLTTPTRFPVVYFSDSKKTAVEFKVLALKYSTLFSFGVIHKPSKETMASYGITKLPHFTAFIVDKLKERQPRIKKIPFIEQIYGPMNYGMLVHFLYGLHKDHFTKLPLHDVNKAEIDIDAEFDDDISLFREEYMKYSDQLTRQKIEL